MGLFRKKINEDKARDFFVMAYSKILSSEEMESNKERLTKLKEIFPLLKKVKQTTFNRHLSAVNMAWLDIAWTKYYFPRGIGIVDAVQFKTKIEDDIKKVTIFYEPLKPLIQMYSDAFGNSYDGNTEMAAEFVREIFEKDSGQFDVFFEKHADEIKEAIVGISYQFVKTFDLYTKEIKRNKLLK